LASDRPRQPNPECPVCGIFYTTLEVDLDRATLKDVIDTFIKETLGFGEKEFVLSNEVGILYDADETDNLPKKLTDLGTCYKTCAKNASLTRHVQVLVMVIS
jgi:ubiquitin-like 1-activating enzyme E1 B